MKRLNFIYSSVAVLTASYIGTFIVYPALPKRIASHWNPSGLVNGYMSKQYGAFFIPTIATVLFILLVIVPRIDPKAANILLFRRKFDQFILTFCLFLTYLQILVLAWNLSYQFNIIALLMPGFSLILASIGDLLAHVTQNWSIGIRSPWTIENKEVWDKTHQLASKLFFAAAAVTLFGTLLPQGAVWLLLGAALASGLLPVVYSYLLFRTLTD